MLVIFNIMKIEIVELVWYRFVFINIIFGNFIIDLFILIYLYDKINYKYEILFLFIYYYNFFI